MRKAELMHVQGRPRGEGGASAGLGTGGLALGLRGPPCARPAAPSLAPRPTVCSLRPQHMPVLPLSLLSTRTPGSLAPPVLAEAARASRIGLPHSPRSGGQQGALPPEAQGLPGGSRRPSSLCPVVAWPPASRVSSSRAWTGTLTPSC